MREIKFRAWGGDVIRMKYNVGVLPLASSSKWTMTGEEWCYRPDQTVLMQYVGLKAYNGKQWADVYEGDILLHHGKYSVVEWSGINLTRRLKTPKGDRNYLIREIDLQEEDQTKLAGYKLCGNIYEKAQLLHP